MEERKVVRYFCSGCDKEYKSKSGCKAHEKICWYIPENEACPTCIFSRRHPKPVPISTLDYDGNEYFYTGYSYHGYDCVQPEVDGHYGKFAEKYNLSVGCPFHTPFKDTEEDACIDS